MRNVLDKSCGENQNINYGREYRPQMAVLHGIYALLAG
jgi:hypothetical protein